MDRLDMALVGADLAGLAALLVATQPVEQADAGGNRQAGPQRADVAAVELVVEGADHQQQHRIEDEAPLALELEQHGGLEGDRKSTRLNSSHVRISYAVFCLKKKKR